MDFDSFPTDGNELTTRLAGWFGANSWLVDDGADDYSQRSAAMIEQDRQRLHQLVESIPSRELVHRTISNLELSISEEGLDRHLTTKDTEQRSQVAMAASGSSAPVGRLALDNVDDCFTYHSPGYDTQERMTQVRESSIALAKVILRVVPDCPDRSTALRELRNVRMWANSALALGGRF